MNRGEYIAAVAAKTETSLALARTIIEASLEVIESEIERGGEVRLAGFGNFGTKTTPARQGRNPHTGALIAIAERRKPTFKPGKILKDAAANGRKAA